MSDKSFNFAVFASRNFLNPNPGEMARESGKITLEQRRDFIWKSLYEYCDLMDLCNGGAYPQNIRYDVWERAGDQDDRGIRFLTTQAVLDWNLEFSPTPWVSKEFGGRVDGAIVFPLEKEEIIMAAHGVALADPNGVWYPPYPSGIEAARVSGDLLKRAIEAYNGCALEEPDGYSPHRWEVVLEPPALGGEINSLRVMHRSTGLEVRVEVEDYKSEDSLRNELEKGKLKAMAKISALAYELGHRV